jgi:hypothetical protein
MKSSSRLNQPISPEDLGLRGCEPPRQVTPNWIQISHIFPLVSGIKSSKKLLQASAGWLLSSAITQSRGKEFMSKTFRADRGDAIVDGGQSRRRK